MFSTRASNAAPASSSAASSARSTIVPQAMIVTSPPSRSCVARAELER